MSCDIDGYNDVQQTSRLRARKAHDCDACSDGIRAGDLYERTSALYDGNWSHHVHCLRCAQIFKHLVTTVADSETGVDWRLDCGHSYEETHSGLAPPDEIARLAFLTPDEAQRELGGMV